MRILLVHSFYNTALPSGENEVVKNQARLLESCGHEVLVWGPQTPPKVDGKDQVRLGLNVMTGRGLSPNAAVESFRPDLIHVHNLFPRLSSRWLVTAPVPVALTLHNYRAICANGVLTRQGTNCTKCISGPVVNALIHGCYRDSALATAPVLAFQRRLRRAARQQVAAVIFTSELSREILEPIVEPQRAVVLPNYVPAINSENQHKSQGRHGFVAMGRLSQEKGFDRLVEVWPSSRKLTILGDGPERVRLETLASGKNIEIKGFVSEEDRDRALMGAQALLLPSVTKEADPVVVAQALSIGTPCIVMAGTATARLAETSAAIVRYYDSVSLSAALTEADRTTADEAARRLYDGTWSAAAWLRGFDQEIAHPLGLKS